MSEPERLRAVGPENGSGGRYLEPGTVEVPVTVVRARRHQPVPVPASKAVGNPSAGAETGGGRRETLVAAAVVLVLLSLGAGVGAVYHVVKPPKYSATIGILITASTASLTDPGADTAPEQRDVTTRVDLLGSALVENRAERQAGRVLPHLQVSSRSDSDVVVTAVAAERRTDAATAVTAYVAAYEALLAAQQKVSLGSERERLLKLNSKYEKQVAALDAQLTGASTTRRQLLLTSQQPRRTTLATGMDDAATRLSRLDEQLDSLPATTKRLDTAPVTEAAASSALADIGTGVLLGVLASSAFLYRRFRPGFGRP